MLSRQDAEECEMISSLCVVRRRLIIIHVNNNNPLCLSHSSLFRSFAQKEMSSSGNEENNVDVAR